MVHVDLTQRAMVSLSAPFGHVRPDPMASVDTLWYWYQICRVNVLAKSRTPPYTVIS